MATNINKNRRLLLIGMTGSLVEGCVTLKERKCAVCGEPAVGWCHMRRMYVCETHRYFTQDGKNWRCP